MKAKKRAVPAEGPHGVDRWTSNGYGLVVNGIPVKPLDEENIRYGMWFEKRGADWFLVDDSGAEYAAPRECDMDISPVRKEEWKRAKAYMNAHNIWDATAFGAGMTALISDAVVKIDGEIKVLIFSTVHCAERTLFKSFGQNFKRKCLRRVDEFYSTKEYQQTLRTHDMEEAQWSDHCLRSIILVVNQNGQLESVVRHKDLFKMDVYPLTHAEVVWFDNGVFDVELTLQQYREQYETK